jgi:hypothetical protein
MAALKKDLEKLEAELKAVQEREKKKPEGT